MVRSTPLLRRLLAGAFGLIVGAAGTIALSTPAAADVDRPIVEVETHSTCDTFELTVTLVDETREFADAYVTNGGWGQRFLLYPGQPRVVQLFPYDSYEVFIDEELVAEGQWEDTDNCGEPTVIVDWELHCDSIALSVTAPRTYQVVTITRSDHDHFRISPEPGTTATPTIENVTEDTVVTVTYGDEVVETIRWEEPADCAAPGDDEGDDGAGDGKGDDGTGGEDAAGDELPVTGSSTLLIAGTAVALLVVGGGLFLVARRRRQTFTA